MYLFSLLEINVFKSYIITQIQNAQGAKQFYENVLFLGITLSQIIECFDVC